MRILKRQLSNVVHRHMMFDLKQRLRDNNNAHQQAA